MLKKAIKATLVLGVAGLALTGCATKSYVDQQDAKILDKLTALESKIEKMHKEEHAKVVGKLKDLETQVANIQSEHADLKKQIKAVDEKAEQNSAAIRGLIERVDGIEAKLDRVSENIERVMRKSLAK